LGAQLIADVLGGRVTQNTHKEIGWFPVTLSAEGTQAQVFKNFPLQFPALHWHGDTFSLPPGASMLAQSEACPAQAFSAKGGRVLGLQFHLESSVESVGLLVNNCSDELVDGRYIQKGEHILKNSDNFSSIHTLLHLLLENLKNI
jgi:GMP synthase-like glutamine amidotransferase